MLNLFCLDLLVHMKGFILHHTFFGQAPLTEELVFRACMIPVLLSGGFKPTTVIFLCPILFSLGKLDTSSFWQLKLPYVRVCECTLVCSLWGMTLFFSVLFVLFRICCFSPYLYEIWGNISRVSY